jgi:ribosome-associated toxin RatA of RatAB toxin-antitoxin module
LPEFRAVRRIAASPEDVFDFVADYRNVKGVLDGVTRWQPLGRATGVGARFDAEMSAAGLPLSGVLVLDRWRRPHEIGWTSESGMVRQRGGWRLTPRAGGTELELLISYEPPGGALGSLAAGPVGGIVKRRLERALERTAELLEQPAEG